MTITVPVLVSGKEKTVIGLQVSFCLSVLEHLKPRASALNMFTEQALNIVQ